MKTRMEHILEIVKQLATNPEVIKNTRYPAGTIVDVAYDIYKCIENREEDLLQEDMEIEIKEVEDEDY